jgi:serpin B
MHVRLSLLCSLLLCAVTAVSCKKAEPPAGSQTGTPTKQPEKPATGQTGSPSTPPPSKPAPATVSAEATAALATSMNSMAVELYRAARPASENFAFSPASISAAFSMLYAGAREDTAQEFQRVFHYSLQDRGLLEAHGAMLGGRNEQCEFASANSLWLGQDFKLKPEYEQLMSASARASLERVDFQKEPEPVRGRINQWISTQTRGNIPELIPSGAITPATRMVLANALYFKGRWKERFEKEVTQPAAFRLLSGKEAQVPTMTRTGRYRMARQESVRLLELEYECSDITLLLLLPETGEVQEGEEPAPGTGKPLTPAQALERLENELSAEALTKWTASLPAEQGEVMVALPRFTLRGTLPLKDALQKMGLQRTFTDGAQLQGIAEGESLTLSDAFHQSFVKVDEEGTEAAAATSGVVSITSAPPPPPRFAVDRPFLFALRHKPSGALLFLGRVTDPR